MMLMMQYTFHMANGDKFVAQLPEHPVGLRDMLEVWNAKNKYVVLGGYILRLDQIVIVEPEGDDDDK